MSMSLRNYGYSTKKEYNERMDAIVRAVEKYGVQSVYERLVKLGEFNPVMKEDAESVSQIYELNEEAAVEASVEAEEEKKDNEKKELFLEMLNVKLAHYKRELCGLLDVEYTETSFETSFDNVYESVVNAYDEKIKKDTKIMGQKIEEFSKTAKMFEKYRDTIVYITNDYEYKQYSSLRNMLTEMSFSEEQIVQDTLKSMVSVLKEHKQCQIVSVSELEKRQQCVLQETGKLMNEISEMVKKKTAAVSECDLEGYDILATAIVSHYKKLLSMYVNSLVYEIRLRDIRSSLRGIPSDMF